MSRRQQDNRWRKLWPKLFAAKCEMMLVALQIWNLMLFLRFLYFMTKACLKLELRWWVCQLLNKKCQRSWYFKIFQGTLTWSQSHIKVLKPSLHLPRAKKNPIFLCNLSCNCNRCIKVFRSSITLIVIQSVNVWFKLFSFSIPPPIRYHFSGLENPFCPSNWHLFLLNSSQ